ncbi:hypothetical protein PanWU01x14_304470 [Parasponia andersonii]|uniref:Uncharacterized protein n=1 Tax=Parasponia andersonii TaxID=3476 RepID=A0A2P5ASL4_PARAD|nr:hypothetical protein PanWU01x14_304470 [Parasponia andersonii]
MSCETSSSRKGRNMMSSSQQEKRDRKNWTKKKFNCHRSRPREQEECPPVGDSPRVEGPTVPKPSAMRPHVSLTRITLPSQPRPGTSPSLKRRARGSLLQQLAFKRPKSGAATFSQGESSQAQGLPLTSRSTEAPHDEEVPPSASQESPAPPLASTTSSNKSYLRPFVNRMSHHYTETCLLASKLLDMKGLASSISHNILGLSTLLPFYCLSCLLCTHLEYFLTSFFFSPQAFTEYELFMAQVIGEHQRLTQLFESLDSQLKDAQRHQKQADDARDKALEKKNKANGDQRLVDERA